MDRLWAPWRMEYILAEKTADAGCIFCIGEDHAADRQKLVLHRTKHSLVMLNRYPYTNGHLMVAPRQHTADLDRLADAEMLDLFATLRLCRNVLQAAARPDGFNIGINLGRAAGAGIEEHVHLHIVPRWNGDTNFMPVVAGTRVVPEALAATWHKLRPFFAPLEEAF